MNRILIAVDGSTASDGALHAGLEIAGAEGAGVVLVHVCPAVDVLPGGMFGTTAAVKHEPSARDRAPLDTALEAAQEHGVAARTKLLVGNPSDEIVTYADSIGADLIVVGSRGLGAFGRMILGSVSRGVLRESRRPVLVVPEAEAPALTAVG